MKTIKIELNINELVYIADGINALMAYYTDDIVTFSYLLKLKEMLKGEIEKCTQSD